MSGDIRVEGAEQLRDLAKALKHAGEVDLRKQLHNGMKRAARPLVKEAKTAAKDAFPKRGGLAAREGRIAFRPQVKTGQADPGVRIVAPGKYLVGKTTNATGRFRHPVFADGSQTRKQWRWVSQTLPIRGWFTRAMEAKAPLVRAELKQAMEDVITEIVRRGRG